MKDKIDFVIWTGDSARHDNDEEIPRTESSVLESNKMMITKFQEVFGKEDNINDTDPTNDYTIPIVPTFGNNDMLPHNIFTPGPNRWTKKYQDIWQTMIPEEQRHTFARGGWFYVEVIPNKLAVFSLNTMYFFNSNSAVDGCARKSEPGYEQMDWLRIQLQFMRQRGMKAILIGHVPPARTESKMLWDETCWQKYTYWMRQYRDLVVGGLYGHMNIDHFMIHDSHDVSIEGMQYVEEKRNNGKGEKHGNKGPKKHHKRGGKRQHQSANDEDSDGFVNVQSSSSYLMDLRNGWSDLPRPAASEIFADEDSNESETNGEVEDSKKDKSSFLEKIGGEWGERYSLTLVSPSVIPNYFPSLRVIEYNVTGIEYSPRGRSETNPAEVDLLEIEHEASPTAKGMPEDDEQLEDAILHDQKDSTESKKKKKKHKKKKKKKKPKKPSFTSPKPPPSGATAGPAYSPQPLSWTKYTQYFANLTEINNVKKDSTEEETSLKRKGKVHPRPFQYEVEYDTASDRLYKMHDLTVMSYLKLARRISQRKHAKGREWSPLAPFASEDATPAIATAEQVAEVTDLTPNQFVEGDIEAEKNGEKKKKKKKKKRKALNEVWYAFIKRAYVNTIDDEELHDRFGQKAVLTEDQAATNEENDSGLGGNSGEL